MAKKLLFVSQLCVFFGGKWRGEALQACRSPRGSGWHRGVVAGPGNRRAHPWRPRKLAPYWVKHPIAPWDIIIHPSDTGLACSLVGAQPWQEACRRDSFIKHRLSEWQMTAARAEGSVSDKLTSATSHRQTMRQGNGNSWNKCAM